MTLHCGGQAHRLELRDDDLVLLDHDEASESVLVALGAEVPLCVQLVQAWRDPPWHDAVPCLLHDDDGAVAAAAGKGAAANALAGRLRTSASPVGLRGVGRLRTSALLLGLPAAFRRASGRRALARRVERWRRGEAMDQTEIWLLERQLDPILAARLATEGRHLPAGGRPVHVHVVGPHRPRTLVPGRRSWDAIVPIDGVTGLLFDASSVSDWFAGG
jgi:hypothetical protein